MRAADEPTKRWGGGRKIVSHRTTAEWTPALGARRTTLWSHQTATKKAIKTTSREGNPTRRFEWQLGRRRTCTMIGMGSEPRTVRCFVGRGKRSIELLVLFVLQWMRYPLQRQSKACFLCLLTLNCWASFSLCVNLFDAIHISLKGWREPAEGMLCVSLNGRKFHARLFLGITSIHTDLSNRVPIPTLKKLHH